MKVSSVGPVKTFLAVPKVLPGSLQEPDTQALKYLLNE